MDEAADEEDSESKPLGDLTEASHLDNSLRKPHIDRLYINSRLQLAVTKRQTLPGRFCRGVVTALPLDPGFEGMGARISI